MPQPIRSLSWTVFGCESFNPVELRLNIMPRAEWRWKQGRKRAENALRGFCSGTFFSLYWSESFSFCGGFFLFLRYEMSPIFAKLCATSYRDARPKENGTVIWANKIYCAANELVWKHWTSPWINILEISLQKAFEWRIIQLLWKHLKSLFEELCKAKVNLVLISLCSRK
jgi:hypothetical protein